LIAANNEFSNIDLSKLVAIFVSAIFALAVLDEFVAFDAFVKPIVF